MQEKTRLPALEGIALNYCSVFCDLQFLLFVVTAEAKQIDGSGIFAHRRIPAAPLTYDCDGLSSCELL